jgi:ribosome biogenesis GTPase
MLHAYGWNDAFQQSFDALAAPDLIPGRVLEQQRGRYRVVTAHGDLDAQVTGRFAFEAGEGDHPVAGDWVALAARPNEGAGTIHHVLPRATAFQRRAPVSGALQIVAANLDVALIVQSLNGDLNPRRLERYLAAAYDSGAKPVIVLTKADLCDDVTGEMIKLGRSAGDAPMIAISAVTGEGLDALARHLPPGATSALLGSSGVGKSTLVNALAGADLMLTKDISGDDKRGRHTTTHRELILLPSGALLLDSPGMRELGVWQDADEGVAATFADVEALFLDCRFSDCSHRGEPGCAVRGAMESGALEPGRWESYLKMQRELQFEARKEDPKLKAEHHKLWMSRAKNYRARKKLQNRQLGDEED